MNKYKLKMKTPTGLGNEYVYVYATSNFERYLNKHNLKYARDITKDYQLTDRVVKSQEKVNQLEKENKQLKEVIDKAIENIEMTQIRRYLLEQEEVVLEILKGGSNE